MVTHSSIRSVKGRLDVSGRFPKHTAAQLLDGADPASRVFGFSAILALAGRAAHLEAVVHPRRPFRDRISPVLQLKRVARQGGALLAPEPFQRTAPASIGSRVRRSKYWASNNSMEPTWPAGSRCQLPLIDTGLPVSVSLT